MNVKIDKDACIGCGLCADSCPEVFALDTDGTASLVDVPDICADKVQDAADTCPVGAIETR